MPRRGISAVVSFVEESDDHRLFIAAALLEDGEVRHVHRKVFLPTYGLFDERRFFAAGSVFRATDSRLGLRLGIWVCEDCWHLATPNLLALDGAQVLINVSSSPGRDVAAGHRGGPGHRRLVAHAQPDVRPADHELRGVRQPRRRGRVAQLLGRLGGRGAQRRQRIPGAAPRGGPVRREHRPSELRHERIATPLLRDERPEVVLRQLDRITRAGQGSPSRTRSTHERRGRPSRPPFELPPELAIETDVRAPHHRGLHPRPAPAGRLRAARAGPVGRHRFGARGVPRGGGGRRRAAAVRP